MNQDNQINIEQIKAFYNDVYQNDINKINDLFKKYKIDRRGLDNVIDRYVNKLFKYTIIENNILDELKEYLENITKKEKLINEILEEGGVFGKTFVLNMISDEKRREIFNLVRESNDNIYMELSFYKNNSNKPIIKTIPLNNENYEKIKDYFTETISPEIAIDNLKELQFSDSETTLPEIELCDSIKFISYRMNYQNNEQANKELKDQIKNKYYHTNEGAFFPYYLDRLENNFSKEDIKTLTRYQIYDNIIDKKNTNIHMQCFLHALSMYNVPKNILTQIASTLSSSFIKIENIGKIGKQFKMAFRIRTYREERNELTINNNHNGVIGDKNSKNIYDILFYKNHYMIYETNVTFNGKTYVNNFRLIKYLIENNYLKEYTVLNKIMLQNSIDVYIKNQDILDINPEICFKKYNENNKNKKPIDYENIYFADFETCTDGPDGHFRFICCLINLKGNKLVTFIGNDCHIKLFKYLPDKSIVYFHNLAYDGRLCRDINIVKTIEKGNKIYSQHHIYDNKHIELRDSYALITMPLKNFSKCFNLDVKKEIFPYKYYTYERMKLLSKENCLIIGNIKDACLSDNLDENEFREMLKQTNSIIDNDTFNMYKYSNFYCSQDVKVLREGFIKFAKDLKSININVFEKYSASSVADEYIKKNVFIPDKDIFKYGANTENFLRKAIRGGRCMTRDNKMHHTEIPISDFDAVSLYPSAMNRLWTVTGTPEVIPDEYLNGDYLLKHLFDADQLEPTKEKFISAFVVEIEITKVNKELHFPIITKRDKLVNNYVNECVTMVVTDIALEDLVKFQKIEYKVIKGYWWKTSRKHTIRNVIRKLFELRLKYKKEGNSLQEIIKLILNSAYGKSIQKPVETSIIYVNDKNKDECIFKKFNMFKSGEKINDEQWLLKFNKGINNQFANVLFGALVLDMSKRIMNEVMCLAEDY